ncbi:MAG: protein kinase [Oscillospiraceae bacterium]|nr:protein kinase [Oscillospiraceae bacterium]
MMKTEPMGRIKTEAMDGGGGQAWNVEPVVTSPASFEEAGEIYDISPELAGIGGESQVYHATARSTGAACVARIATSMAMMSMIYDPVGRENRKKVVDFLRATTDFKKHHIMPLLASGTISIVNSDGAPLSYPIDIFPFCQDGNLGNAGKRFSLYELKDRVIPAINAALKAVHDSNLIHRDIKPENIYELYGEIVVSDFGTAVTSESGSSHTELARRTLGYSAPEINSRYAKQASDYFSFGCTLATLYNGKHPYEVVLDSESDYAFYELINEKGITMEYRKGDEALKGLIDALVRLTLPDRIGYEGVELWLSDEKAFHSKYGGLYNYKRPDKNGQWETPFSFEDVDYWDEASLAVAMLEKWTAAKRYLYRGQVLNFFSKNQTLQNRVDKIINEEPTAKNDDLGLACFLHYLVKGGNIFWCGREYKDLAEIATAIFKNEKAKEKAGAGFEAEVTNMLKSRYLSWKLKSNLQIEGISQDMKSAINSSLEGVLAVESVAEKYPKMAYYYTMFMWGKEPGLNLSGLSPDLVFSSLAGHPSEFYEKVAQMIDSDYGWAKIAAMGYSGHVMMTREKLGGNMLENIEKVYLMFESICAGKSAVRKHYYTTGPYSYLHWLKCNLSHYEFHSDDARNLQNRISGVAFSDQMQISDIQNSFRELDGYFSPDGDFQKMFQNDFLFACLGIKKGSGRQGEITAAHADAFFTELFFGKSVPAGFLRSLGMQEG